MRRKGEGLVVVLGWSLDDFCSVLDKAPAEELAAAKEILILDLGGAAAKLGKDFTMAGVRAIDAELARRGVPKYRENVQ